MLGLTQHWGETSAQRGLQEAPPDNPVFPPLPAPTQELLTSQCFHQVEDRASQLRYQLSGAVHQALKDSARRTVQGGRQPTAQALFQLGTRAGAGESGGPGAGPSLPARPPGLLTLSSRVCKAGSS